MNNEQLLYYMMRFIQYVVDFKTFCSTGL